MLQDRCVAHEGVIRRFRKRQEIKNKAQDQYKEAVCTLNKEVTAVIKKLKQESNLQEKAQKATDSFKIELMTLREQSEKAKADVIAEFRASQPFTDACAVYYGNKFDNCLKQVGSIYLNLDLSKITKDAESPSALDTQNPPA